MVEVDSVQRLQAPCQADLEGSLCTPRLDEDQEADARPPLPSPGLPLSQMLPPREGERNTVAVGALSIDQLTDAPTCVVEIKVALLANICQRREFSRLLPEEPSLLRGQRPG